MALAVLVAACGSGDSSTSRTSDAAETTIVTASGTAHGTTSGTTAAATSAPNTTSKTTGSIGFQPHTDIEYAGTGPGTITFDGVGPAQSSGAIHITHDGPGPIAVTALIPADGTRPDHTAAGAYDGRRRWMLDDTPIAAALSVETDSNWRINFIPLVDTERFHRMDITGGGSYQGVGDDIFDLYTTVGSRPTASKVTFTCPGCTTPATVNMIGTYGKQGFGDPGGPDGIDETVPMPDRTFLIEVITAPEGTAPSWTITVD